MKWVAAALMLLTALAAHALELRELGLEYRRMSDTSVFPELGPNRANESIDLRFNVDLLGPIYWENTVHSMSEVGGHFQLVGWHYSLGVHITDALSVSYEHFSQHLLDHPELVPHFPMFDAALIRWTIYQNRTPAAVLFH